VIFPLEAKPTGLTNQVLRRPPVVIGVGGGCSAGDTRSERGFPRRKRIVDLNQDFGKFLLVAEIATPEFGFVNGLPKREKSRWQRVREEFDRLRALTEQHGMLVPVHLAAALAGVSHQRIHQLMDDGRLERVDAGGSGHPFVTERSLCAWADSERKTGRPCKYGDRGLVDTIKTSVQSSLKARKK